MLIVPQSIEVKWINKHKKWYVEKGYKYTKNNDIFIVDILDLTLGSNVKIKYICDYCKETFTIEYCTYNSKRNNGTIKNDCCRKCSGKKLKESNLINFGVESNMHIASVKEKVSKALTLDSETIRQAFIDKGYEVVDFNYINSTTHIKYICPKHRDNGIQKITYNNLKNHDRGCRYCGNEKISNSKMKYNIEFAKKAFDELGLILIETNYINNTTPMKYICKKHTDEIRTTTLNSIIKGHGCWFCYLERSKGENSYLWKGGITPIHNYIRSKLSEWKKDSMRESGYKCVITGDTNWAVIHHLYPFNKILRESFEETGVLLKPDMSEYTEFEKQSLEDKILEIHYRYPLGVCLRDDVHNLFHNLYGDDFIPEQFEEFKNNYINGKLDHLLKNKEVI